MHRLLTNDVEDTMSSDDNAQDQTVQQDPTDQYDQPDTSGEKIEHPGRTGDMGTEPDHGEKSYQGSGRLEGKRAVITGGDSGIGRAVAIAFAREGADVMVVHLDSEQEDADTTVGLIEQAGRRGISVAADLREEQACQEVIKRAVDELGGIDVLVNNAAYQMTQPGGIADITTEQFDRVMRTNLYATFWLSKGALEHMNTGGSIINTTSIQGSTPSPELLDYAMTKAALISFTQGLAQMVGAKGIRVNAVAPGPIWTPLIPATMHEEKIESFGESTPLGRAGQPAELAPAYVFLASQESSYITGAVVPVTGGNPF
jgi:NAD(P)-dependent dehydrogenase (short-subunit alcohol dehydrogenase family)